MTDLDWCRDQLPRVSRTFALGIRSLPAPFEAWVTVGYLLCRVIDTVEDTPDIPWARRRQMFTAFDAALETGDTTAFDSLGPALADTPDGAMSRSLSRILSPMADFPPPVQAALKHWTTQMSQGMASYAERHALNAGQTTLADQADLERYCYFVAGTVGHLLTDLFLAGAPETNAHADELRANAEGFGLLLQLTNIVKDVTDDAERGWCFIPETFCAAEGIESDRLVHPDHQAAAIRAIDRVNMLARDAFDQAVSYVVALPASAEALRRFCLFPMLLARATLDTALGDVALVERSCAVKVSRDVVEETAGEVEALLSDDMAIAALTAMRPGQAQ
jgi:phytoene/squalene synthetase